MLNNVIVDIIQLVVFWGQGNSKVEKVEEEVEKEGVVDDNSPVANENGRGDVGDDSVDKLDSPKEVSAEDNTNGSITAEDESRPLKKTKSVVEEKCCFGEEVVNGDSFSLCSSSALFVVCLLRNV